MPVCTSVPKDLQALVKAEFDDIQNLVAPKSRKMLQARIVAEIQGMKDLGAAGVLIKPFDPRKLAADVLALLR